jgi:hypothetical protein
VHVTVPELPSKERELELLTDLPHRKDKAGARRMRLMARPRRTRKGEDPAGSSRS